jgi:hypothetical protein
MSVPDATVSRVVSTAANVARDAIATAPGLAQQVVADQPSRQASVTSSATTPIASSVLPDFPAPPTTTSTTSPSFDESDIVTPEMRQLVNMGFTNIDLNRQLLAKYNYDITRVVNSLLGM